MEAQPSPPGGSLWNRHARKRAAAFSAPWPADLEMPGRRFPFYCCYRPGKATWSTGEAAHAALEHRQKAPCELSEVVAKASQPPPWCSPTE